MGNLVLLYFAIMMTIIGLRALTGPERHDSRSVVATIICLLFGPMIIIAFTIKAIN